MLHKNDLSFINLNFQDFLNVSWIFYHYNILHKIHNILKVCEYWINIGTNSMSSIENNSICWDSFQSHIHWHLLYKGSNVIVKHTTWKRDQEEHLMLCTQRKDKTQTIVYFCLVLPTCSYKVEEQPYNLLSRFKWGVKNTR